MIFWVWFPLNYSCNFMLEVWTFSWNSIINSSCSWVFYKIAVFKNFAEFTTMHLCWSLFLNKLHAWGLEHRQKQPATLWILWNFKNSYAQLLTYNNWRQNQYWKNLILDKITYIKVLFYKNNHKRKNTFISLNL